MNLEEFVEQTIVEIVRGVIAADVSLAETGAAVNPGNVEPNTAAAGPYGFLVDGNDRVGFRQHVQALEFDVVVSANEGKETKGGIGIYVGAVGLGSAGRSETGESSESRIRFSIPLLLPNSDRTV